MTSRTRNRVTPRPCKPDGSRLLRCLPSDIGFCDADPAVFGFRDVCLRQKYGSRLGHASLTACTACSARRIHESEASRLLRTEHVNAKAFALLSASHYFCRCKLVSRLMMATKKLFKIFSQNILDRLPRRFLSFFEENSSAILR